MLHLGNIDFDVDVRGYASLNSSSNNDEMHWVSKVGTGRWHMDLMENRKRSSVCISSVQLLGIPAELLHQGLTHRKIEAKTEEVTSLLWSS